MANIETRVLAAVAAAVLSACSADGGARPESAGATPAAPAAAQGLLSSSVPANGAKLRAVPGTLVLNFARPVRLAEVKVTGSDGSEMPMMVSSAGSNRRYELPLDGLEHGSYTVHWRAIDEAHVTHEGDISFEIA